MDVQRVGRLIAALVRTTTGTRLLWLVGTVAILAAVAITGEVGLLTLVVERELLALVAESSFVYAMYAWRTGAGVLACAVIKKHGFWYAARAHLVVMRWAW